MTPKKGWRYYAAVPMVSRLAFAVWKRDRDVYLKTYKTSLVPPLLEPILYLLAFGFGLGALVREDIGGLKYIQFIAPAMIALAVMNASSFECTYGSYVRMYYQKTFNGIIATPVSVEDVIAGEMLWGATKSALNAGIMVLVMLAIEPVIGVRLVAWQAAVPIVGVSFAGGLLFASIAMCFTAVVRYIDHFNYFIFLVITPMMLLCGTFFPIAMLPGALQTGAQFLPLTHVVIILRELATWNVSTASTASFGAVAVSGIICFIIAVNLMRTRLVK